MSLLTYLKNAFSSVASVVTDIVSDERNLRTVFVYGSLRKGFGNSGLLRDATFLGVDYLEGFNMVSCGGFPAIYPVTDGGTVYGEVYEVNDETFKRLDSLEGVPYHYQRAKVRTVFGKIPAWVYVQRDGKNRPPVDSGDWADAAPRNRWAPC